MKLIATLQPPISVSWMDRAYLYKKLKVTGIHVLCWWVFLSLPALFNSRIAHLDFVAIFQDLLIPPRIANGVFYIILFYCSYYAVIPEYYFKKRYGLLSLYFFTSFVVFFIINYLMMPPWLADGGYNGFHMLEPSYNLYMYITVCIFSFTFCLYTQWHKMYEENLNTEISFLKAQINPHFLFNTLNSIYSLTLTKSDEAPEAVLKLSGMMRYAVTDTALKYVSLDKELEYIVDYIDLQSLRLVDNIRLEYNCTGNTPGLQVAPFILIPFVENAFKYGVNTEEDSHIRIDISIERDALELRVWNKKVTVNLPTGSSAGVGIKNTKKRLQLLYPGKHVLTIENKENDFSVLLKIDLR